METVRLSTGHKITLDGDVLSILEALYREITLKHQLHLTFEELMREIRGLVEQMSEENRKRYLVESLFMNQVTFENEMIDAYLRKLTAKPKRNRARAVVKRS